MSISLRVSVLVLKNNEDIDYLLEELNHKLIKLSEQCPAYSYTIEKTVDNKEIRIKSLNLLGHVN
jgi:hypothetical protein